MFSPLNPTEPTIIHHNHQSFTHEELLLLCAFKQLLKIPPKSPVYTPLDDDTIAEILKYARGCYDPLSITGLYERIMDPELDARVKVAGELAQRSAYWFERVTVLYWAWMGGMRKLCERKLADGTLDPYGRVPGSGCGAVLWQPRGEERW